MSSSPVLDLAQFARAFASPTTPAGDSWCPLLVGLRPGEFERFAVVCKEHRIAMLDTIERQLADLAVIRLPSASNGTAR